MKMLNASEKLLCGLMTSQLRRQSAVMPITWYCRNGGQVLLLNFSAKNRRCSSCFNKIRIFRKLSEVWNFESSPNARKKKWSAHYAGCL